MTAASQPDARLKEVATEHRIGATSVERRTTGGSAAATTGTCLGSAAGDPNGG